MPKKERRTIRTSDEVWERFGEYCESIGSDRSTELRRYMIEKLKEHSKKGGKKNEH